MIIVKSKQCKQENILPGITTMQVTGIKPTLKKGGKINV